MKPTRWSRLLDLLTWRPPIVFVHGNVAYWAPADSLDIPRLSWAFTVRDHTATYSPMWRLLVGGYPIRDPRPGRVLLIPDLT